MELVPNVTTIVVEGGSGRPEGSATGGGDGSGTPSQDSAGDDEMRPIIEQYSNFPADERIGQMYSYEENRSSAVLRTRLSSYGDDYTPVHVGIESVAAGEYACLAANANLNVATSVSITVVTGETMQVYVHTYIHNNMQLLLLFLIS